MTRVLFFSHDVVGPTMAGPGIRYWELASEVARSHDVTLAAPGSTPSREAPFRVVGYNRADYHQLLAQQDVCVTQLVSPRLLAAARLRGVRLIADMYDPMLFEELEQWRDKPVSRQRARNRRTLARTRLTLAAADAVLCASDRQRDLWIGALLALDRLTPSRYRADDLLEQFVAVVPFGLPRHEPRQSDDGPRRQFLIPEDATLLLWGGGVWNWFDPLTLLRGLHGARQAREDLHLVFMGIEHPNPRIPTASAALDMLRFAQQHQMLGESVHVNPGWVPYLEREAFLFDADIGVSLHSAHLETRYAFRTRLLDYIWAGLPVLASEGDELGDLVRREELGAVVAVGDVAGVRDAILKLARDSPAHRAAKGNLRTVRAKFHWDTVAEPLLRVIDAMAARPQRSPLPSGKAAIAVVEAVREVVLDRRVGELARRTLFGEHQ